MHPGQRLFAAIRPMAKELKLGLGGSDGNTKFLSSSKGSWSSGKVAVKTA